MGFLEAPGEVAALVLVVVVQVANHQVCRHHGQRRKPKRLVGRQHGPTNLGQLLNAQARGKLLWGGSCRLGTIV